MVRIRVIGILAAGSACLLRAFGGTQLMLRPPGELLLHLPQGEWKHVRLISEAKGHVASFAPTATSLRVSPLPYGPYRLQVELPGGSELWVRFYHSDTRACRTIEIDAAPSSDGRWKIREIVNHTELPLSGSVSPAETSREHPLTLDWI